MKLRLVNFRCYTDKTFDFEDVVLISAENGAGKSSILLGIQYCLYGSKTKGAKLVKYGQTSCKVELTHDRYHIIRSSKPSKLELTDLETKQIYEDDGAQGVINSVFGDCFTTTSFMSQNPLGAFITMGPTEKLEFLEKFAFKGIDIPAIKDRCKLLISQKNEELQQTISQLAILQEVINETKEPTQVTLNFKYKAEDRPKYVDNISKLEKRIEKTKKQLIKLRKTREKILAFDTFKSYCETYILDITNKVTHLEEQEKSVKYEGDLHLSNLQLQLSTLEKQARYIQCKSKFEEVSERLQSIKEIELNQLTEEIDKLEAEIGPDIEDINCAYISSLEEALTDAKEITRLKKAIEDLKYEDINDLETDIHFLQQQKCELESLIKLCEEQETSYTCPCCDTKLKLINGKLEQLQLSKNETSVLDKPQFIKDLTEVQKKLSDLNYRKTKAQIAKQNKVKLENKLNNIVSQYDDDANLDEADLQNDINETKDKLKKKLCLEKLKFNLDKKIFSKSCMVLEVECKKLEKEMLCYNLESNCSVNEIVYTENELREMIQTQTLLKSKLGHLQEQKASLINDIQVKEEELATKTEEINTLEYDTTSEANLKTTLLEAETKLKLYQSRLDDIKSYDLYVKELESYESLKTRLQRLKETEKIQTKKLSSARSLREEILKAESISVGNIIENINNHAQLYLDIFFEHEPMSVTLKTFRETKKNQVGKAQINVEVQYKGEIMDLETLSGGELSRVILAFTLALNEISNSPLLLLDESTASLNQEATSIVFDAVQEHCKHKTCLIIGHQIVEGTFNQILKL